MTLVWKRGEADLESDLDDRSTFLRRRCPDLGGEELDEREVEGIECEAFDGGSTEVYASQGTKFVLPSRAGVNFRRALTCNCPHRGRPLDELADGLKAPLGNDLGCAPAQSVSGELRFDIIGQGRTRRRR